VTAGRARTVFVGSGAFGRPSLERLRAHPDIELVGAVTAPPKPAGRGGRLTSTPIAATAAELGVEPVLTPDRLRAPESREAILRLEPDLLVLADYGQIVPPELLDVRDGALNVHPSLLPRHRGATPVPATILAGDRETGVTLMRMDAGLDTGPIVAQRRVELSGTENAPDLEARLALVGGDLLAATVGSWLRGALAARPQPEGGATMTRLLRREDGRLDAHKSAVELERQVRAYQPWPGSFVDTPEGRVIVWKAEASAAVESPERQPTASLGTFDFEGFGAADGGRLRLIEVQLAGGRRMTWQEFVRGRPAIVGASILP
jgi:methionyl-tRNA formyltransferase